MLTTVDNITFCLGLPHHSVPSLRFNAIVDIELYISVEREQRLNMIHEFFSCAIIHHKASTLSIQQTGKRFRFISNLEIIY